MEREAGVVEAVQPMTAQVLTSAADLSALAPNAVYLLPRGTEILDPHLPVTEFVEISKTPMSGGLAASVDAGVVFLQHEYARWQAAKQRLQLTEDHQLAAVLLDLYEESAAAAAQDDMDNKAAAELLAELEQPAEPVQVAAELTQPSAAAPPVVAPKKSVPALAAPVGGPEGGSSALGRLPASISVSVTRLGERPTRPQRTRTAARSRPCPKSKKPGFRRWELGYHSDDDDNSAAEDDQSDDVISPKLFNYPPVEPELLKYFSCGLCDQAGVTSVEEHFDHLWKKHTEFHMVGGRIQRIPIRLRPQLFVMCALCGLNNRGSAGDSVTYLTTAHLPVHAPLLAAVASEPLHCDQCSDHFEDRGLLALHVLDTEHRNDPYRCAECDLDMEGRKNYIVHLQRHYLSRVFQCYFCMALFTTETGCVAHIKRHHVDDYSVHKCSSCGYATALFHDFLLHVRSHSQLNRHVCHVCGVMFVSKMSLKHHIPTHSATQFPCDQCGRVFAHPQTLRRHVLNAHHNPDKCTCNVCGRQFGSAFSMRRHHMIHTGERPFQCDKCGRGFVQKGDLHAHHRKCSLTEVASVFVTAV